MSVDVERYSYRLPLSEQNGLDAPSPHSHKVEEAADYRPGLHHPIHLGEYIGARRQYRVLTKIAVGRNSLVWLCRNVREKPVQYVAIKIRHARLSHGNTLEGEREMTRRLQNLAKDDPLIAKYCLLPIDEFESQGPNGTHQCLVYPAAGPQLLEINRNVKGDPVKFLRKLAYQAVEAMAALHRHGICHRDFGPHKLLLRQDSLTSKSKRKVLKYLEDGVRMKIRVVSAQEGCGLPRSHAPEYLVHPIQYDELGEDDEPKRTKFTSSNICLIDFGESFTLPNQPPRGEVSGGYCAPEMLLESSSKAGMASDIWSLAYTIYEIRTGVRLSHGDSPHVEDHLVPMVEKLGPLPEPWWSTTWKTRRAHFKDELDADGMAIRAKNIRGDLGNEVVNEGDDSDYYSDEDDSSEDDSGEDDSGEDDSGEDDSGEYDDDEDDDDEDRCYISDDGDSETDVEESDSDSNDENDFVFCTKEDFLTSGSGGDDSDKGNPVSDGSSNEHKLGSPVKNLSPLQWTLDFSGVRHFLRRSDGKLCHGKVSGMEEYLLVDLLSKMLRYDPNERPTAEQVLKHPWFSFRMKKKGEIKTSSCLHRYCVHMMA